MQATAAACQVNNLHLIRGLIGKPGLRHLPDERPADRAEHPRVRCRRRAPASATGTTPTTSPSWPGSGTSTRRRSCRPGRRRPTRCRSSATPRPGSIKLLWIIGTNPAVSHARAAPDPQDPRRGRALRGRAGRLPDRDGGARRRGPAGGDLGREDRHASPTPTAPSTLAQGVEPPGEARSDLDIFLDYARRMDFRDKDGDAAGQVVRRRRGVRGAGRSARRGRPCDYTRPELRRSSRGGSGIQWPCNEQYPDGTRAALRRRRLPRPPPTTARRSGTTSSTGAAVDRRATTARTTRRAGRPQAGRLPAAARGAGRRVSVLADHRPGRLPLPHADQDRPAPGCNAAAPEPFVQIAADDAEAPRDRADGDMVEVDVPPRADAGCRRGSATSSRGTCLRARSTTATGTTPDASTAPPTS